jgi:hypothetical protein
MRLVTALLFTTLAAAGTTATADTGRRLAPLKIELQGRADGDRLVLDAAVLAPGHLPAAPVLRVVLPPGATLEQGLAEETLPAAARTERRFVVRGAKAPVRVEALANAAGAGVHARAQWPAAATRRPAPAMQPLAPVRVNGVVVEQAVPLRAK